VGLGDKNDDRTLFMQHQTPLLQVFIHLFEQHLAKTMGLQEAAELENSDLIR